MKACKWKQLFTIHHNYSKWSLLPMKTCSVNLSTNFQDHWICLLDSKSEILSNRSKSGDGLWSKLHSSGAQNVWIEKENPWKLVAILGI